MHDSDTTKYIPMLTYVHAFRMRTLSTSYVDHMRCTHHKLHIPSARLRTGKDDVKARCGTHHATASCRLVSSRHASAAVLGDHLRPVDRDFLLAWVECGPAC